MKIVIRPPERGEAYVAIQNLPYFYGFLGEAAGGGVLAKGQLVWVQTMSDMEECPASIHVYVDYIGIVSLDPRWLRRNVDVR